MTIFSRAGLSALILLLVASMVTEVRASYHFVTGVDPNRDNFLALRDAPSSRTGRLLARLGPDTLLRPLGRRSGRWLMVEVANTTHSGRTGWVFDGFVGCCIDPPEYAYYLQVAHPGGSALNMRTGPSLSEPILTAVPHGMNWLPVYGCRGAPDGRTWCNIAFRGQRGWVSARYAALYSVGVIGRPPSAPADEGFWCARNLANALVCVGAGAAAYALFFGSGDSGWSSAPAGRSNPHRNHDLEHHLCQNYGLC